MPRRLVLVATTRPWRVERAVEELGDALYPLDAGVRVAVDKRFPLIYVYSVVEPWRAFRVVVSEPPAYVERVVPVEYLFGSDWLVRLREEALGRGVEELWVEVKPRGYFISGDEKLASRRVAEALRDAGLRLSRRAALWVKVEDTVEGVVVAFMAAREDRVEYWRRRRLRV